MDEVDTETSAEAPLVVEPEPTAARPAHFGASSRRATRRATRSRGPERRRRWPLALVAVPVVLLLLVITGWAVDSRSDKVARNVELAGTSIGGLSEDELVARVQDTAAELTSTPVHLVVGDQVYETTAGDIGLSVDEGRTTESALDVGDSSFILARPFAWARSLVSEQQAPVQFQVDAEQATSKVIELEGDARTPPTEPTVKLVDGHFEVVPGKDGKGLDTAEVIRRLPGVAEAALADEADAVRLELDTEAIPPLGSEDAAQEAADAAEELVSEPLEVHTGGGDRTVSSDQLRSWVQLHSNADGTVVVSFDEAKAATTLRRAFADVEGHPVNATFTLEGGVPVIRPDKPGTVCCTPGSAATALAALQDGQHRVDLELTQGPAAFTAAKAKEYGITQPVGGNNAWRNGAPTTGAPGFTTYHDPSGARITNIHRMADIVRGAVVAPGASFSINDYVGERTLAKGFVTAGAIREGQHVEEVGGGVSQFATTMFNAAYFAGLKIDESQAHSEYFDRYPRGREATMGYPAPDLRFTNNTPYGIMIWTSYTQSSLTITLYSTPYARGEQTAISESKVGSCTVVTTTRTITYPDGKTKSDKFRATYRPGEGQRC
ncbi:MAG: VanW family protein [Acidimicrobiales bacterium]